MPYLRKTILELENNLGTIYRVRELRIAFSLNLSIQSDPSSSTLKVYNLAPDTEDQIFAGTKAHFYAGYSYGRPNNWVPPKVYQGTIVKKESERSGTERAMKLILDESYVEKTQVLINRSWGGNLSPRLIALDIAQEMGYSQIENSIDIPSERRGSYYAVSEPAGSALTKLLRSHGMAWFVDRGSLVVTKSGDPASRISEYQIDSSRGMIGTPTLTDDSVKVKSVLVSDIRIAQPLRVVSPEIGVDERVKVVSILHKGDTWGDEFVTEIEGTKTLV